MKYVVFFISFERFSIEINALYFFIEQVTKTQYRKPIRGGIIYE